MATVREIASYAGVSASTVSRVQKGIVPVNEETKEKVLSAIKDLELQKITSRSSHASKNVGIIIPAIAISDLMDHPSLYSIVLSFIESLGKKNIGNTTILLDEKMNVLKTLNDKSIDAFFILGTSDKQESFLVNFLNEKKKPYLFNNRIIEDKHASSINLDEEQAIKIAVDYLVGLNHSKIAFIGGNSDKSHTKLRYNGFIEAMRSNKLQVNPYYVLYGEYQEKSGYEMGEKLLQLKDRPTAACAASDTIAIGLIKCMQDHGLQVPKDFSVVGYGNIEASEYIVPHLTTISQKAMEMGSVAASTLIQLMDNPLICRQRVLIKTEIIIRDSCARK